ncbi:hypothetical protein EJ02DRAFT_458987 [Clathrospora elynae]|uniref:Uncharacterized protein n=1 Tax=Clathrospora elynae TaxID=706981 RepID=A0A6A5S944_9PLEO|nr:hypothetical protein EJ02DRAFT_458987 [Clathrospora elynae]
MTLLIVLPTTHTVIKTVCLTRFGYLNTDDSRYRTLLNGILMLYAIGYPLQHLTVALWHLISRYLPTSVQTLVGITHQVDNNRLVAIFHGVVGPSETCIVDVKPWSNKSENAEQMLVQEIPKMKTPKLQARLSTRRRG